MISHEIEDYIRVQVDVEPEDDYHARFLYGKWLKYCVAHDIASDVGSSGPSGFIAYIDACHLKKVKSWLAGEVYG